MSEKKFDLSRRCVTEYGFYGDNKAIEKLDKDLRFFTSEEFKKPENGCGWIENILSGYEIPLDESYGIFRDIYRKESGELIVTMDTYDMARPELWDNIINKHFTNEDGSRTLNYVYLSQCLGNKDGYFNSDKEGKIFPQKYLLEIDRFVDEYSVPEILEYFISDEELVYMVNAIFNVFLSSVSEVKEFLEFGNHYLSVIDYRLDLYEYKRI